MGEVVKQEARLPEQYEPQKGLKAIAVAEAAEIHYARAKDTTRLFEAVETKLSEQRRFVLWWDNHKKNPGGNPSQTAEGLLPSNIPTAAELGLDYDTIHRWRKRLKNQQKFDAELEKATERCAKIAEFRQGGGESFPRSLNSGENEWYTPIEYIEAVRNVLGNIDLDPASSEAAQKRIRATHYFTKDINGLAQTWKGSVWLNPPYAQPLIAEFVAKLIGEKRSGRVNAAIMLTNNSTDTSWFQAAVGIANAICFTRGRIKFIGLKNETSAPLQGQAFFYFGENTDDFTAQFLQFGFVVQPIGTNK